MSPDEETDTMPSIPASTGTSPFRSSCARCLQRANEVQAIKDEHSAKVRTLMGPATFVNQGADLNKHSCVFCAVPLYGPIVYALGADAKQAILYACSKVERLTERVTGFWPWRKRRLVVTDPGCPAIPHLHRSCRVCKASWVERASFQERG